MRIGFAATVVGALLATSSLGHAAPVSTDAWMSPAIVARQKAAGSDAARKAIAAQRARALVAAMTLDQKLQQLTGNEPEVLPELPQCFGGRHVGGIAALSIPTFRITNGPVGVGQNDCVSRAAYEALPPDQRKYMPLGHPSSAKATALPSGMAVAASFDPEVATAFGEVIAREMNALALHVWEAPGMNLARLPILGRNFEYFGEDPYLSGTMAVAEIEAVQRHGLIAMAKHFAANEQETNRFTIREAVDDQVLRELYLIPFEMSVKAGNVASIMCSYNYVNGLQACENTPLLTDVLRNEWGFKGYVQSDFYAVKSTVPTLTAGLDHEMPNPLYWAPAKMRAALAAGEIRQAQIDTALLRRYTQMFKAGIFDRPIRQTPIDIERDGQAARDIGTRAAVLLQNNGALPLARTARRIVLVGKATQVYAQQAIAGGSILGKTMGAGGGSSDVVPERVVDPLDGLREALRADGRSDARVSMVLVDDANRAATIDGRDVSFADALRTMGAADAVIVMAGTNAEEGADRATFTDDSGKTLAAPAQAGMSLDWYVARPSKIATASGANAAGDSGTNAMLRAIMDARSTTDRAMAAKTALVLKDNASVALERRLIGAAGPSILEVWFPGQEDGAIVADLLLGRAAPGGKLPVTFPVSGATFLDTATATQFPGVPGDGGKTQHVRYSEGLNIGYRWYDADASGRCAAVNGRNPCVAFPFGHGLTYTSFTTSGAKLMAGRSGTVQVAMTVLNTGARAGAEVVQAYVALPPSAGAVGLAQPPKRLVGFQRVTLAPGESRTVTIAVDPAASNHPLSVWSTRDRRWVTPKGRYTMMVGTSSAPADLVTAGTFTR